MKSEFERKLKNYSDMKMRIYPIRYYLNGNINKDGKID